MTWIYQGRDIRGHNDLFPECTDIVYEIQFESGEKYIGKKAVRAFRLKPPLKGKKRKRRVMTNLPFVKYQGSNDLAKELVPLHKIILYQCSSRKTATFLEIDTIFHRNALFDPVYLNDNILGKFFSNSLDGLIE